MFFTWLQRVVLAALQTHVLLLVTSQLFEHRPLENVIALAGAAGFGASLVLIHIYVKPLKRFLQLLWATGLAGSLYLMATQVCTGLCDPAGLIWAADTHMPAWLP